MLTLRDSFILLFLEIYNSYSSEVRLCVLNEEQIAHLPIQFCLGIFYLEPTLYIHGGDPGSQVKDEGPGASGWKFLITFS